jgi:hypothetical protein
MSTVTDYDKCEQCGYNFGVYDFDCRTNERVFHCMRCGYSQSSEWITAEDGTRIGWQRKTLEGHGAVWATRPGTGISTFHGLHSAKEVEIASQKMRTAIANGELNLYSSYVTKWNPKLKRAELEAGSWCQEGEVFGAQPFDIDKFPFGTIGPEDDGEEIGQEKRNV